MTSPAYRENFKAIDWTGFKPTPRMIGIPPARSHLPAPMVISDTIEVRSMVDGEIHTSKSGLRRSYREKGYLEVGNEEQKPPAKPQPDEKGIREAVDKAFAHIGLSD